MNLNPIVEIKPSPDGDGFCLKLRDSAPIWFANERQALSYAQEVFATFEIVLYEGEGIIKRRYAPSQAE